jgi:hypothetical protein
MAGGALPHLRLQPTSGEAGLSIIDPLFGRAD